MNTAIKIKLLLTLLIFSAVHIYSANADEDKNLKKILEFNLLENPVMGPEQLLQQNRNQAPTHLNEQKLNAEKEKKARRVREILAGREGLVAPDTTTVPSPQLPKESEKPANESR